MENQTEFLKTVLKGYLEAWQKKDWQAMSEKTQDRWRDSEQDPAATLENMWGNLNLIKVQKIHAPTALHEKIYEFPVDITFELRSDTTKITLGRKILCNVVQSLVNDDFWGVNPTSCLRGLSPEKKNNLPVKKGKK